MDRRGKRVSSGISRLVESEAAGSGLSGVARGSEWPDGPAGARRDNRADGVGAAIRMESRQSKLRSHPGSESGQRHFPAERVDAACAVECGRPAASFCKPLNRVDAKPLSGVSTLLSHSLEEGIAEDAVHLGRSVQITNACVKRFGIDNSGLNR